MPDATSFAKLFGTGLALFYGVQKFFGTVEDKLREDTKSQIARWMLEVERPRKHANWAETFLVMFDTVFGAKGISLRGFAVSAIATVCILFIVDVATIGLPHNSDDARWIAQQVLANVVSGYVTLVLSRLVFGMLRRTHSAYQTAIVIIGGAMLSILLACGGVILGILIWAPHAVPCPPGADEIACSWENWGVGMETLGIVDLVRPAILASLIASAWLWVYSASGFLIRASLRLPFAIPLLNRKFDVEKKPLQCLGFMAGGLVTVGYWGWALANVIL